MISKVSALYLLLSTFLVVSAVTVHAGAEGADGNHSTFATLSDFIN